MEITNDTRVSDILEQYGDIADVMEVFGIKREITSAPEKRYMLNTLSIETRKRLSIQGFADVDDERLAPVAPRLRVAFGGCAFLVSTTDICNPSTIYNAVFLRGKVG